MKYLKKFNTQNEYQSYIKSADALRPNVSLVDDVVNFHPYTDPFYIDMIEDGTIKFSKGIYYQKSSQSKWSVLYTSTKLTVTAGDRIYFKNVVDLETGEGIGTFTITGAANLGGNSMSLLYGDDYHDQQFVPKNAFKLLFNNATSIKSASALLLPATELSESCYSRMFYGCSNLINTPRLPATILARSCYSYMFYGCSSLIDAPRHFATTLAEECYSHMYYGCTALMNVHDLPTVDEIPLGAYGSMFQDCSSLVYAPRMNSRSELYQGGGDVFCGCKNLEKAPDFPYTRVRSIRNMFRGCSSLIETPEMHIREIIGDPDEVLNCAFSSCTNLVKAPIDIDVDTLGYRGAAQMFYGCTSLKEGPTFIKVKQADHGCFEGMFRNCKSLETAPEIEVLEIGTLAIPVHGPFYGMFRGCEELKAAPVLSLAKPCEACYAYMFEGCTSLEYIKMTATDISANNCLLNWVDGVATTGTFIKAADVEIPTGVSGIPEGWAVEEVAV